MLKPDTFALTALLALLTALGPLAVDMYLPSFPEIGRLLNTSPATVQLTLSPSIELLLTARAVQALGSSGAIVLARAIVRDLYSGARAGRELSLMGAIMALAPVGAPMIGGVLQSAFGWRSHFVLQVVFGLIAGFL